LKAARPARATDECGWRATFYVTGIEHSLTADTASAWEPTTWRAVQVAAREALRRAGLMLAFPVPVLSHRFTQGGDRGLSLAYQHIGSVTRLMALLDQLARFVARLLRPLPERRQNLGAGVEVASQALAQVCTAARAQVDEAAEDVDRKLFLSEGPATGNARGDLMSPAVSEEQRALFMTQPSRLSAIRVGGLPADVLDGVLRSDEPSASRASRVRHDSPPLVERDDTTR
jgi:hypothetical protein